MKHNYIKSGLVNTYSLLLLFLLINHQTTVNAQNGIIWQKCFGGPTAFFYNMCKTTDGNYFLLGLFEGIGGDFNSNYGDADIGLIKIDSNGNKLWTSHYGSADLDAPSNIIKGYYGRYYIIGNTNHYGFTNFHGYPEIANKSDAYVICIDEIGNIIWQHCYGGYGSDNFLDGVIIDSNYLYAMGETKNSYGGETGGNFDIDTALGGTYDVFICKIRASDGSVVHSKRFGGTDADAEYRIAADGKDLILLGSSWSSDIDVPVNYGYNDAWVLKIDTAFNLLSSHIWGGKKNETFYDAFRTEDKGYYLFGNTENIDSLTGNLDFVINSGLRQLMIIKTDSNFQTVWQKSFGCNIGSVNASGWAGQYVIQTPDKGYVFAHQAAPSGPCIGSPFSTGHTVFIKLDSLGNEMWVAWYGSGGSGATDRVKCILGTNDGGLIVGSHGHVDANNSCNSPGVDPTSMWNIYKLDQQIMGTEQIEKVSDEILVYPIPATNIINVNGLTTNVAADVYDISGKLLLSKQLYNNQIDISPLAKGLYFIKLSTAEGGVVRKFMKE